MAYIGAIIGDIAGSMYEFDRAECENIEGIELFTEQCSFTDDTVMTLAIKYALDNGIDYQTAMREIGQRYPLCGYGGHFFEWIFCTDPRPYNSFGNGSAMRTSYIADFFKTKEEIINEATKAAAVSHNHPEGIKGAVVTSVCIYMAKNGTTKQEIYDYVLSEYPSDSYPFSIDKDLKYLRGHYSWDVTCMTSVPVAMRCFYESEDYVSFLRNVFALDCDADTLAAIGGGVAEEFYHGTGLKNDVILSNYLDERLYSIAIQ